MKVFYFDVETTGLDPAGNGIVQLAYIMEKDGNIIYNGNLHIRPYPDTVIDKKALEVHGYTEEKINTFMNPGIAFSIFLSTFDLFIDKYDKSDKAYPCAYNGNFDLAFLREFFIRNNNDYLFSYLNTKLIDPLAVLRFHDFCGLISLDSYSLSSVCASFKIPLQAHDAMSDVSALRSILNCIMKNNLQFEEVTVGKKQFLDNIPDNL